MAKKQDKLIKFDSDSMHVLDHFFNFEFICDCGKCKSYEYRRQDIEKIALLRKNVNMAIKIIRSHHCENAHKVCKCGDHSQGRSFDIRCPMVSNDVLRDEALRVGFKTAIIQDGFLHISTE